MEKGISTTWLHSRGGKSQPKDVTPTKDDSRKVMLCISGMELLIMERIKLSIKEIDNSHNDWDCELAYSKIEELGCRIGRNVIEKLAIFDDRVSTSTRI